VIFFGLLISFYSYPNILLDGSGRNGSGGMNGRDGSSYGADGQPAEDGKNGRDGLPVNITLFEQNNLIGVVGNIGSRSVDESMEALGNSIQIYTNGGDGGHGGSGGDGYVGRNGRNGINGKDGRRGPMGSDGRNGTRYAPDGENGSNGGRGGDGEDGTSGEDGTDGGNGANGGNGGSGGDGAAIVVKYHDPALLIHIDALYVGGVAGRGGSKGLGGRKGEGGAGGKGGDGGQGGYGGKGGRGYQCSSQEVAQGCRNGRNGDNGHNGYDGRDGSNGRDGFDGDAGRDGFFGSQGRSGRRGSVSYIQLDENNLPIPGTETDEIYRPMVKSFNVVDENRDGIFEPGEKILISNIVIQNTTKMSLPQGSIVKLTSEGLMGEIVNTLPTIKGDAEYTVEGNFELTIKPSLEIGADLWVDSEIEFRGIRFNSDNHQKKIEILRPIVVKSIEYKKFIPFSKPQVGQITLENISTKAHDHININYVNSGNFSLNVLTKVSSIPAGKELIESFEITATDVVKAYETSKIDFTLLRDQVGYQSGNIESQVIPSFEFKNSEILIVSNGHTSESYEALTKALDDLKLSFEIYDINLEGALSNDLLNKYHNKAIVFANQKDQFSLMLQNAFNEYLKFVGGIYTIGFNKTLKPTHYMNRLKTSEDNYFELSYDEQNELVKKGVVAVMGFDNKLELVKKYYRQEEERLYQIYKDALIQDIQDEYLLFKNDKDIYDGNPYIDQYQNYVLSLNAVDEYDYRMELIGVSGALLEFDEANHLKFVQFKKHFKKVKDFYDDMKKLKETCGEIKGVYFDDEGKIIQIYKYSMLGGLRAETQDLIYEFRKGKEVEKNVWEFTYKIGNGQTNEVRYNLFCDNGKTYLKGMKSHGEGGEWTLVKIYSQRMWNNQQP